MSENGIVVKTSFNDTFIIQETYSLLDEIRSDVSRIIYDTSDRQIQDALRKMGWNSPQESARMNMRYFRLLTDIQKIGAEMIDAHPKYIIDKIKDHIQTEIHHIEMKGEL